MFLSDIKARHDKMVELRTSLHRASLVRTTLVGLGGPVRQRGWMAIVLVVRFRFPSSAFWFLVSQFCFIQAMNLAYRIPETDIGAVKARRARN
jgi:hypothetical protein